MPQENMTNQTGHQIHVHDEKFGNITRKSFSKIKNIPEIPDLIELQKTSYKKFIEHDIAEILAEFSPICDRSDRFKLYFEDPHLEGEPKYSIKECKERDATYSKPLKVKVRLERANGEITEEKVFMGDIPLITDNGSFI